MFGFADSRTLTDNPGMSHDALTIPSHPYAQFAFDALSS
jgi:hypothetical protein